jgi:hypothetical protein
MSFAVRISHSMVCAEYQRLQQQYEDAVRAWAKFKAPETVVLPGRERPAQLEQEALKARNKAADLLYLHRRRCPQCKS